MPSEPVSRNRPRRGREEDRDPRSAPEGKGSALHRTLLASVGGAGRHAGLGLQFALTIGLFALAGYWLDGRLGTDPWLLLGGIFLGGTAGLVYLVKTIDGGKGGRGGRGEPRR